MLDFVERITVQSSAITIRKKLKPLDVRINLFTKLRGTIN
jgi:hypothetical protein